MTYILFFLPVHTSSLLYPSQFSTSYTRITGAEFSKITTSPIIFNNQLGQNIYKEYSWAGTSISHFYGWPTQKIAEIWFNSTQRDGLTKIPGRLETLEKLIEHNPGEMLGSKLTEKPVFCKILGKNEKLPHILHSGFNNSIIGNKQFFIELCITERSFITKLQEQLSQHIHDAYHFQCYKDSYDDWTRQEILVQWHNKELLPKLPLFMAQFDTSIFNQLRETREKLVSYLNEIPLEEGMVVLSPVGNIHSIVGSHQMHPPASHPEAKNEAYYIFSAGTDQDGNKLLLYFEPQQTSNTTYSPFDFACPIEFRNGKVLLRKDLTKGLDALFDNTQQTPKNESQAIELMLNKAIRFEPTRIEDLIINDKIQDITQSSGYKNVINSKVESLIKDTYPPAWKHNYFTLERITLHGNGKTSQASVEMQPTFDSYHELFVVNGTVEMLYDDITRPLPQGSAVFVPACYSRTYIIESSSEAEVLKVFPG